MMSSPTSPAAIGRRISPGSASAETRLSANTVERRWHSTSSSHIPGVQAPTALTCAPSAIHSPSRMGSVAGVSVQITSAPRTQSCALSAISISVPARPPCRRANSVALIQADLLDVAKLPSLAEQTVQTFGRLDALVNNASTFYATTIGEIEVEQWNDLIGTNLQAPLFLSQAAAPALRKTQGAIVNITDIHADRPLKSYVVYSVAKAGLVGLTRSLARELAPEVRVNAIAPGPILWPDQEVFDELARQRIISHTPLKREGTPDDIAKAVHYLLADAPYVTGETINVDGGRHIAL